MERKPKCLICEGIATAIVRILTSREEDSILSQEPVWQFKVFRENKHCFVCQSVAQYFLSDDPPCQLRQCNISVQGVGSPPRIWFYPVSLHSLSRADFIFTRFRYAPLESAVKTTISKYAPSIMSISNWFHQAYLRLKMSTLFLLTIIGSMWNESGAGRSIAARIMPDLATHCPRGRMYPGLNIWFW